MQSDNKTTCLRINLNNVFINVPGSAFNNMKRQYLNEAIEIMRSAKRTKNYNTKQLVSGFRISEEIKSTDIQDSQQVLEGI